MTKGINSLPHNGTPTSKATAEAVADTVVEVRLRSMKHFVHFEPNGFTANAMQILLDLDHESNSPRFGELAEDKLIYDTGEQRPTRKGYPAAVWRPTDLGIAAIIKGWYTGDRLTKGRRKSRVAALRDALTEALRGWAANTTDPDQLAKIAALEPLTKASSRRKSD